MSGVLLAVQLALATALVVAAAGKLVRSEDFAAVLRLSRLPGGSVGPLTVVVPAVELALAAALILTEGAGLQATLAAVATLMAAFTAWMVWVRARGLRLRCGCFGAGGAEVGALTIVRNLVLLAAAGAGIIVAAEADGILPGPSFPMGLTVVLGMTTLVLGRALWGVRGQLVLTMRSLHELHLAHSHGPPTEERN